MPGFVFLLIRRDHPQLPEFASPLRCGFGRVRANRFLKAELARADVGYRELAERLEKHGLSETEASIADKISRGTFSATFPLVSLIAIEAGTV